jgi:uncharacterized protein YdhG (YjbR/CyaY superfamily)
MVQSSAATPEAYLAELTPERREVVERLREVILEHLPEGFEESMSYGMIGYVVPHSVYPDGYHCSPDQPLPFMNLASQKNYVAVYHMGIYADESLLKWFRDAWSEHVPTKLDMGKSCIRLKKMDQVPYELIGELAGKMSAEDWIARYESAIKR